MGHTTDVAAPVHKDALAKMVVWDVPGNNDDFSYLDINQLAFFHSADLVFLLYDSSLLAFEAMVRAIVTVMGNKCILLRTKCDTWTEDHALTLDQEIERDKAKLAEWGLPNDLQVYKTSALGGFDNDLVKHLLFQ